MSGTALRTVLEFHVSTKAVLDIPDGVLGFGARTWFCFDERAFFYFLFYSIQDWFISPLGDVSLHKAQHFFSGVVGGGDAALS